MTVPGEGPAAAHRLRPDLPRHLAELAPVITVIGDVIVDEWIYGTSERLAREAPAPVIDQSRVVPVPGGAANTAVNLAALGARVRIVGLVGTDDAGARLRSLLSDAGVDTAGLLTHPDVHTTVKSRVVVADQVMFRLDRTGGVPPGAAVEELTAAALDALPGSAAVIVCDYGTALGHTDLPERLTAWPDRPLTVVDAHEPRRWAALRPDIVTPNAGETEKVLGRRLGTGAERVAEATRSAAALTERTGAGCVAVTLDRDGTVLLGPSGLLHRTWARPATEKQASGAGDTFVAALTLGRTAGLELPAAAELAQAAADVVVHRLGTSLCATADLVDHLSDFADAIVGTEQLLALAAEHRAAGRRIVLTNGCFDVLHRGHTSYLAKARQLGDVLVVAVNDDDSTRRLKGPDRPLNPLQDRAGVLAALNCVDYVTAFSGDTPIPLIERLQPEIYVKGGDYTPQMLEETEVVRGYGGQVRIMEYVSDHSTSSLVQRMRGGAGTTRGHGTAHVPEAAAERSTREEPHVRP